MFSFEMHSGGNRLHQILLETILGSLTRTDSTQSAWSLYIILQKIARGTLELRVCSPITLGG
jgi:hypothetical protein